MTEFRYLRAEEWGRRWAHAPQAEKLGDPEVYVHHTAGNDSGDSISRFRAVNESDISRGYAGVGYDILVHRDQSTGVVTIGEGRGPWRSAATLDRNEEGEAVCLIGYFHPGHKLSRQPHPDEIEGVARGIVWGIEHGWIARDARILGHRDNPAHPGATGCPGDYLYAQLPTIRRRVQELLNPQEDDMLAVVKFKGALDQFVLVPINDVAQRRKMGIDDTVPYVEATVNLDSLQAQLPPGHKLTRG